ncbi:hypothetical protein HID58_022782 [Brassica napus]|uniref:Uncharacterized protein n=2 Tax=Brassica TaxID=3705 RepID=A0ABQ8D080_BRANA|nr:hypothetical protein HID58_022782 [Brassica napus]
MVLAELGGQIASALQKMSNGTNIDEKVLNECLKEITRALLHSDVSFPLMREMQNNIKKIVNLEELAAGHNKRQIIEQAIFSELCKMLDPGKPAFKERYFGLLMFRCWAGAFDQLKQNATKARIPFYGRSDLSSVVTVGWGLLLTMLYTESYPVKIAVEGVDTFKKENCDLIIVDTSGRHKQEATLFEEMRQVAEATELEESLGILRQSMKMQHAQNREEVQMHVKRDPKEHNFQRLQQQEHAKVVDISKRAWEFSSFIEFQEKEMKTIMGEREKKMAEMNKRYFEEMLDLEREFDVFGAVHDQERLNDADDADY